MIILDEMDAIARKRGNAMGDTSGVRDSVVNQLLAKMDGVKEASNVLVIGLTNRPELLDDALLRPGRLEVKLEVSLPDLVGRRDILRIHTRSMRANGALAEDAACFIDAEDAACSIDMAATNQRSLASLTEHFTGAELAGLVRSAASFALGRTAVEGGEGSGEGVTVARADFEQALSEVRPARGRRDEQMARRFEVHGCAAPAHDRTRTQLRSLVAASTAVRTALLVPDAPSASEDAIALAAWAGCLGGPVGGLDYVRMIGLSEQMSGGGGASEDARCQALVERFVEARSMRRAMLIIEDIDLLLAAPAGGASTPAGLSPVLVGTLRGLIREPLDESGVTAEGSTASRGSESDAPSTLILLSTISDPAAARALAPMFPSLIRVPMLTSAEEAAAALRSSPAIHAAVGSSSDVIDGFASRATADRPVGAQELFRLADRALAEASADMGGADASAAQLAAFEDACAWRW